MEKERFNGKKFFKGFAHGFLALTDEVHLMYKCSNEYSPANDAGIIWNDPDIGIEWPVKEPLLSAKDSVLPRFSSLGWIR